jgi:CRP/FNR family transcriptional regulator
MLTRLLAAKTVSPLQRPERPADRTGEDFAHSIVRQLNSRGPRYRGTITTRTFRRGQHLYWPSDTPECVYSIYGGTLKTYRVMYDSGERISGFHFAGELLGLDALIDRPARRGAIALDTAVVCLIPIHTVVECLGRSELMRLELLECFDDEIVRLEEHLSLERLSAEQRVATFVLWAVEKLSGQSAQATVQLPMSHKDIGNYLGLVPETVSRLFARFQEHRWLSIRRHELIVRDLEQLQRAAGGGNGRSSVRPADSRTASAGASPGEARI